MVERFPEEEGVAGSSPALAILWPALLPALIGAWQMISPMNLALQATISRS